ncbi:hypothetical protein TrVE_jg13853 [Triparma verrucosa]|uniref:Uncharacterized protein n=1 Tax=Triparma verrucosa TaxID=1606542 RepID=A0A9W7KWC6_9STRA|nr:hypothetical protein TrVE_jg13853 [Triparma verrucosa]
MRPPLSIRKPFVLKSTSTPPTRIMDSFINDGLRLGGDHGKVEVLTSSPSSEVSANCPVRIYYTPPPTFTPTTLTLSYNAWTSDSYIPGDIDYTLSQSLKDSDLSLGTHYVNFVVPNFALQLKLSFHDTFNFDMGPSGEGFKIHVTDVQVERDGKIYEARHDPLTHTLELISEI